MNILIISTSVFPEGSAYAARVAGLSAVLRDMNHVVHVISDYTPGMKIGKVQEFTSGTYEGLAGRPRITSRARLTITAPQSIRRYMRTHKVDLVIAGHPYDRFNRLSRLCRLWGVPFVLEVCEWHDTSKWQLGRLNPYRHFYEKSITKRYDRADGVIAISTALAAHFTTLGLLTVRVPTLMDVHGTHWRRDSTDFRKPIRLVQVGFAGLHKEKYSAVLCGLLELTHEDRSRFEYHIYGADREQVLANLGDEVEGLAAYEELFTAHGRISQNDVPAVLLKADYSIFFRPQTRANNYGFPTKLAESLATGTPVVTNATGDIPLYLHDGVEGFLTASLSPAAVAHSLRRTLSLSTAERDDQRVAARFCAESFFDIGSRKGQIREFLKRWM